MQVKAVAAYRPCGRMIYGKFRIALNSWMRVAPILTIRAVALMCSASPRASIPRATGSASAAGGVHSLLKTIDNSLKADLNGDAKSDYPNQETREVIDAHWVEVCPH